MYGPLVVLMDSQELRSVLDLTQDKIVVVDEDGTYRYVNAATERILGYDRGEFIGTNVFEYVHDEDFEAVRSTFGGLISADGDRTETVTFRHRAADDSWVWFESRMWGRADAEVGGYVVSSRDITARKEAETRRQETEDRLRQIAANAGDVLWMFSADWERLLFVNDAYEDVWGMSPEELEADPTRFLNGVHPDDRDRVRRMMERLSEGTPMEAEYRVSGGHSAQRWVWAKGRPIVEDGEVTKIAGFARDVTDRRRRERQLRVLDDVLRHNLRNVMNVVLGHADLARERGDEGIEPLMRTIVDTGTELLDTVEKERQVVNVLLDSSGPSRTDLDCVLVDVLADVRGRHPEAAIETDVAETTPVLAVPEIRQALCELLENAIEHAEGAGAVAIDVRSDAGTAWVRIRDDAPPIPGNETEPLFAENDPSSVYHGTGLGLWLVYWVVDMSDGNLSFDRNADDTGNVVTIGLPEA